MQAPCAIIIQVKVASTAGSNSQSFFNFHLAMLSELVSIPYVEGF